jgi:hypothetical protein
MATTTAITHIDNNDEACIDLYSPTQQPCEDDDEWTPNDTNRSPPPTTIPALTADYVARLTSMLQGVPASTTPAAIHPVHTGVSGPLVGPVAHASPAHWSTHSWCAQHFPPLYPPSQKLELCFGLDIFEEAYYDARELRTCRGYRIVRHCPHAQCLFAHSFDELQLRMCPHVQCVDLYHCPFAHPRHPHVTYTRWSRDSQYDIPQNPLQVVEPGAWRKDRLDKWLARKRDFLSQLQQYQQPLPWQTPHAL